MRVLLFVEPHPIRDSMTHFADVARGYLPLLSHAHGLDIRLFANDKTFEAVGEAKLAPRKDRLIRSTRDEEHLFRGYMQPWETDGIPIWLDLMAGKGGVTETYIKVLRRIYNVFPFEVIVHWGENGAVSRFVEERPVTRVAMELGCTRPPFFDSNVMDPFGTNGSSVVPKLSVADLRDIVDDQPMSRHEALLGFSQNLEARGYVQQFQPLPIEFSSQLASQKLVFLPLQLFDDANLLRFSPYDTLSEVVLDVVPKLARNGYTTIIKAHPASKFRKGSHIATNLASGALRPWADRVIWSDKLEQVPNARLFAISDFVVTVNSSVGFEALYFDKPVVVLGDAVYKPKDLFPTLDMMISNTFHLKSYLENIALLRRFMLGGYLQPDSIRSDISAFGSRLALIDYLSKKSPCDPSSFARDFWRSCAPAQQALVRSAMFRGISVPGQGEFSVPSLPAPPPTQKTSGNEIETKITIGTYSNIVRRLVRYSSAESFALFIEWLEQLWAIPIAREQLIKVSGFVDPEFYLETYSDIREAGVEPVDHFCRLGISELRAPCATIRPATPDQTLAYLKLAAENIPERIFSALVVAGEGDVKSYRDITRRLLADSQAATLSDFLDWLYGVWDKLVKRAGVPPNGEIGDPNDRLEKHSDDANAEVDPVEHFCLGDVDEMSSLSEAIRAASAEQALACLVLAAETLLIDHNLPTFPLSEEEASQRNLQLGDLRANLGQSTKRLAVVAHLYYRDLVPQILDHLKAINDPFDLIITLPNWGNQRIFELVQSRYPEAIFYETVNRGRDIAPFIDVLPALIDKNYDAILKIQTKRGYYRAGRMVPEFGRIWSEETFSALLGSPERVEAILTAFQMDAGLNMVGPEPYLLSLGAYPYHDKGALSDRVLLEKTSNEGMFFAGTMFWVRPDCLRPFLSLNMLHFAPEDGTNDGALAHLIERMFGHAATVTTGTLAAAPIDPEAALVLPPLPVKIKMDAYLTARLEALSKRPNKASKGDLIW